MIEIWMEGYAATGESGTAQKIWEGDALDFDDAIKKYNADKNGVTLAEPYTRNSFDSEEAYLNRRSNWKIWGCALFDNEVDARKAFG